MSERPEHRGAWAVRLPAGRAAAALRLWPGLRVRTDDETGGIWVRGSDLSELLELELRKLPGAERFTVDQLDGEEVLLPVGRQLPAGFVPAGDWTPIAEWFRPALPAAALSGAIKTKAPLGFVRSARPGDANLLLTSLPAWNRWAIDAAQVRLRRLSFAAAGDGRVIVRGTPLPPIAGRFYVERSGVAVPGGWEIQPAIDAATVRSLLDVCEKELVLLCEDGSWERVPADGFVAASRGAARATSTT